MKTSSNDHKGQIDTPELNHDLETNVLQALTNAIPAPIFYKDSDGKYLGCNKAFEEFVGRSREEIVGKSVFELWEPDLAQVYHDADTALFKDGGKQIYEGQVTYADGTAHDVMFHKASFHATKDDVGGIVGVMLDITDRKRMEADLERMARTDALTGLGNRYILFTALEGACKRAKRHGTYLAVLALDLDGFKSVNDTHGHPEGDTILEEVAERLRSSVREADTIVRMGGDEFFIVLEEATGHDHVAKIARTIIENIAEPYIRDFGTVNIGISIGIAVYGNDGTDAKSLIKRADRALYTIKAVQKGGYSFFPQSDETI